MTSPTAFSTSTVQSMFPKTLLVLATALSGCAGTSSAQLVPEPVQADLATVNAEAQARPEGHTRIERTIIEGSDDRLALSPAPMVIETPTVSVEIDRENGSGNESEDVLVRVVNRTTLESHFASRLLLERSEGDSFVPLGEGGHGGVLLASLDAEQALPDCTSLVPGGMLEVRVDAAAQQLARGVYRVVITDCSGSARAEGQTFEW